MKKILSIFMVVVLIVSVLCGCGKANTPVNTVEEVAAPQLKVGLICLHDEQSTYDLQPLKKLVMLKVQSIQLKQVFQKDKSVMKLQVNQQTLDATLFLPTALGMKII